MTPWVLISGASAGLGAQFARYYAGLGYNLVLTARRTDRLEALAKELAVKCCIVTADLADKDGPRKIFEETERQGIKVDYLINNAGYGLRGTYESKPWTEYAKFMQVMVTSVCELTHLYLPGMRERGFGRMINVASVAGILPASASDTLYGASKSFIVKFSQSLNGQMTKTGVHVTALCPGFFHSEYHDVLGVREEMNKLPKWFWLTADQVVVAGAKAVEANQATVVPGVLYKIIVFIASLLPHAWASALLSSGRRVDSAPVIRPDAT